MSDFQNLEKYADYYSKHGSSRIGILGVALTALGKDGPLNRIPIISDPHEFKKFAHEIGMSTFTLAFLDEVTNTINPSLRENVLRHVEEYIPNYKKLEELGNIIDCYSFDELYLILTSPENRNKITEIQRIESEAVSLLGGDIPLIPKKQFAKNIQKSLITAIDKAVMANTIYKPEENNILYASMCELIVNDTHNTGNPKPNFLNTLPVPQKLAQGTKNKFLSIHNLSDVAVRANSIITQIK